MSEIMSPVDEVKEVVALRWYARPRGSIGFVALLGEDPRGKWFKVYVDIIQPGSEISEEIDADRIAEWGAPVGDEAMARVLARDLVADREYRS